MTPLPWRKIVEYETKNKTSQKLNCTSVVKSVNKGKSAIQKCMAVAFLKLNDDKSEFIIQARQ